MPRRSYVLILLVLAGLTGALVAPCTAAGAETAGTSHSSSSSSSRRTTSTTVWTPPPPRADVVFDAKTGVILASSDEHEPFLPASTQKLMTAVTALTRLPLSTTVPISARAASVPNMNIGAKPGQVWRLDDLLHALLIISGNDAAYAIAERTSGTVEQFATLMSATGRQLGLRDSTFNDPAGLDGREGVAGGSHISAYDLAIVARNALAIPELAGIVRLQHYDFTGPDRVHHLDNHNIKFLDEYAGADGMKTGFTDKAQNSLVASATRNGRTLVAVLLDSNGGEVGTRHWAETLLDNGFRTPVGAKGTGEVLPPVRVFTADARAKLLATLARPLGSSAVGATGAARATGSAAAPSTARPASAPRSASPAEVAGKNAAATTQSSGGIPLRYVFVLVLVVLTAAFVVRRRAVVRRRQRRRARMRPSPDFDVP
ncbi:MAG TPA: D-alanyl-D-alanine carboxypeptidase [Acidimicrobiia bacterium]